MTDKQPSFTVTDRRKFTLEGDVRDESSSAQGEVPIQAAPPAEQPRIVSAPAPEPAAGSEPEEQLLPPPTAQETAEQHAAYEQSSRDLDHMLLAANPGMQAEGAVGFEHVVQSIYLSAVIAMGAGTEPGQKPRIDILGARQSIDMLNVLQEKTKGNLSEKEQRLLQNALFELRMMFLEITNAISQSAKQPPAAGNKR